MFSGKTEKSTAYKHGKNINQAPSNPKGMGKRTADEIPSTSTLQGKRLRILENSSVRKCEDCNVEVASVKWFNHCETSEHKTNVQKYMEGKAILKRSCFKSRIVVYRLLNEKGNLNINTFLD